MAFDLQLIRTRDFILGNSHGMVDAKASKQKLAQLAKACKERVLDRVLLDLRDLQFLPVPVFTPNELAGLVDAFREMGFSHEQRLAVLYKVDPHHGARMFAFISRERGWNVHAFDNYEDAIQWLALSQQALAEAQPGGR
jgi:hypothetical protein